MLEELITWTPQEGFQGVLRRVGLQDVIQMECLGRNSSILEIHNQQLRGRIYIEDGQNYSRPSRRPGRRKRLLQLLALPSGEFQLHPFEPPPKRTIEGQWEFLLMEAARVRDETGSQAPATSRPPNRSRYPMSNPPPRRPIWQCSVEETLICSGQGEPFTSGNARTHLPGWHSCKTWRNRRRSSANWCRWEILTGWKFNSPAAGRWRR